MFDKAKKLSKEVWWFVVLSSAASIIFGLLALVWPKLTLVTLVFIYAIFIVVFGVIGLFEALSNIKKDRLWWLGLLFALLNIGVGVFLLRNPLITAAIFVILLAVFIVLQALFDFVIASYMNKDEHRWLWVVTGILGIVVALTIIFYPVAASLAFVWVLGLYALVHGVVGLAYAFQIRGDIKKLLKK